MKENDKYLSRRKFLTGAGASIAGIALAGGIGTLLTSCAPTEETAPAPETTNGGSTGQLEIPEWPWPIKKIDPEAVLERAYESYKDGG